jgi:hypothetical protein
LDEGAAEKTVFKGLAASGWHTAAISMGLTVEVRPFGPHPLMGLGVDELRWMLPVRPGDVLHVEGELVELIPSRTKPQGIAKIKWTTYNQRGEAVYTFTPIGIVPRRANPAVDLPILLALAAVASAIPPLRTEVRNWPPTATELHRLRSGECPASSLRAPRNPRRAVAAPECRVPAGPNPAH